MMPGIIFLIFSVMLFIFAYLLYFKEAYWLISGINFSPRQTVRARYDLPGLTKHFGRMCALIGLIMLISGIGAFVEYIMLILIPLGFLFVIIPVFLFGSERYMYVGRKTQRIINIVITVFMTGVAVFVVLTMLNGAKASDIHIEDESIVIGSTYGTEIPLDSIHQVDMMDLTGKEISKINGFNMGDNLKGIFRVEGLGTVTIYQQGEPGNSVYIKTDDKTYLINLGSEAENENLKSLIIDAMKK